MNIITETIIETKKGAKLRVFIENQVVKIDTPAGIMIIENVFELSKNEKRIRYSLDDKFLSSEIVKNWAFVKAMFKSVKKPNRELAYFESINDYYEMKDCGEPLGIEFEEVESSEIRPLFAYVYG